MRVRFLFPLLLVACTHAPEVRKVSSCVNPGSVCQTNSDCCGQSMCRDNFCSSVRDGDTAPGGHCNTNGDCAGQSMCRDGYCSSVRDGDVPVGGHCQTSGDCEGQSMCRDNFCR